MSERYTLKSGQINFENNSQKGSYSCVVIKDGVFHNLNDDHRRQLLKALNAPQRAETNELEDMF